jgi:tetratricopeptide (TPR) repeat protein
MSTFRAKHCVALAALFLAVAGFAVDNTPAGLVEAGHYKRAYAVLEKRLAANPKDAEALVLMARVKLAYNDSDTATKLLQQAIALQPNHSWAHLALADAYSRKADSAGMFEKMHLAKLIRSETEQAIALDPKNLDALDGLVDFYLEAPGLMGGSRSKADETANRIAALDASQGNLAKAKIALHEKEYDKVEGFRLKAVEANPKSYDALISAAGLYTSERWKNFDKAIDYAQKAMQVDPTRSASYSVLAQIYASLERWSDLDQLIAKSEKAVPDNLSPHYAAGRVLINTGKDNARAERYFRQYLTQEPEGETPVLAGAHWRLGLALEKEGRKQEAIKEVQIAVQMKPDLKEAQKDLKRMK